MKKTIVCGAGGFIGTHLVENLKHRGYYVVGVDLKYPKWSKTFADEFYISDLTVPQNVYEIFSSDINQVWQLAADMGGAEYIFTGKHDAQIMTNSVAININVLKAMVKYGIHNVFYTSSACAYPAEIQEKHCDGGLAESDCYPANPDSEYGWEKLFSERLYMSYAKNYGIQARIARLHNIFGPYSEYQGGKEKSPAAICRKIATTTNDEIEIFGDGLQLRSYLYIDECITGMYLLNNSNINFPINLGSDRMISINNLVEIVSKIAKKNITTCSIDGPLGVAKRYSNNKLIQEVLSWSPQDNLEFGLTKTYNWIKNQIGRK